MIGIALIGLVLVLLALAGVAAAWAARAGRTLLDQRLGSMENKLDRRLGDVETKVDRRLEGLDGRLLSQQRSAGEAAAAIAEKLGKLDTAAGQLHERVSDLRRLEQALRPPKARGGFGELLLGNLLRDILPSEAYSLQYGFKSGERVDAVIKVDKLIPVDAKFPLDNFERLVNAEDDVERASAQKLFTRDVNGHADAIAAKYIRPGEGTYDFAFMYVPSESVYYEVMCGAGGCAAYAAAKHVFPVSPTMFHAYLQVIAMGLRGLQVEQHAKDVMAYCSGLNKDFGRFREKFDTLGKHLGHAQSSYGDADRRLAGLERDLERATDWDRSLEPGDPIVLQELPRAADAA
jgi:DNA recombination protein RmuC